MADATNARVLIFSDTGSRLGVLNMRAVGLHMPRPSGVVVRSDGRLYVADTRDGVLRVYQ